MAEFHLVDCTRRRGVCFPTLIAAAVVAPTPTAAAAKASLLADQTMAGFGIYRWKMALFPKLGTLIDFSHTMCLGCGLNMGAEQLLHQDCSPCFLASADNYGYVLEKGTVPVFIDL